MSRPNSLQLFFFGNAYNILSLSLYVLNSSDAVKKASDKIKLDAPKKEKGMVENKKEKKCKKEMDKTVEDSEIDLENLPEEMRKAIQSVKKP
jgi:hypothetical protein